MSIKRYTIISKAIEELGRHDHETVSPTRYFSGGYNWCGEFVSYVYKEAGYPFTNGRFSSRVPEIPGDDGKWMQRRTLDIILWFKQYAEYISPENEKWYTYKPQPGDFVHVGRSSFNSGLVERLHSGIVEYVADNGSLHTIEGNNAGRRVMRFEYENYRTNRTNNGLANGVIMGIGILGV